MNKLDKTGHFLAALAIALLLLSLLLTLSELQRHKRMMKEARIQVDTIYRGTVLAQEFCDKMIEEAKCKPL